MGQTDGSQRCFMRHPSPQLPILYEGGHDKATVRRILRRGVPCKRDSSSLGAHPPPSRTGRNQYHAAADELRRTRRCSEAAAVRPNIGKYDVIHKTGNV